MLEDKKRMKHFIVITFLFWFVLMLFYNVRASADEYDYKYALVVSTGEEDGEDIGMFIVTYKDTDGNTRKQYINPNDGDYTDSLSFAAKKGVQSDRRNNVKTYLGYKYATWDNNSFSNEKPMRPYSSDTYLVDFYYKVDSVIRVDAVTSRKTANLAKWSCTDIRVYKVKKVNGLKMYGFISEKYYVDFTGTLLARLEFNTSSHSRTLSTESESDKVFKFGSDYVDGCKLVTDKSSFSGDMKNYDASKQDLIYFYTEIADQYGAGIEAFTNYSKKEIKSMYLPEVLNYTVTYRDTFGAIRKVTLPVITSSVGYAMESGVPATTKPVDIAGQGEEIAFAGVLPDYAELISEDGIKVEYGTDAVKNAGLSDNGSGATSSHSNLINKIQNNFDAMSVWNVTVYNGGSNSRQIYSVEDNTILRTSVPGDLKLIAYHPADSASGIEFGNTVSPFNSTRSLKRGSVKYKPNYSGEKRYLVVIGTHNSNEGATDAEIMMRLNYVSTMGPSKSTNEVSLKTQVENFYGYWPDTSGNDAAYRVSVSRGMKAYCYVTVPDLSYFTGVTFTLDETMQDNWQLSSFDIYEIKDADSVSYRKAKWIDETKYGKTNVNMLYYRTIDGKEISMQNDLSNEMDSIMHRTDMDILFTENQPSKTIEFISSTVTEEEKYDWITNNYYNMSYDMAQQNILFGKKSQSYEVTVNVSADKEISGPNGDTGSANYFYFQLIFENGASAYVQANQQLASDSFRSGIGEVFTISTNRDYGNLTAINIIPDQSTSEASPYDKLMIDTIDVKSKTNTGLDFVWTFDVYDWIGIDYVEASQNDSTTTKVSRTAGEITKTYYQPRTSRSASLLFTAGTGELANDVQFYGKVKGKLNYKDRKGDDQHKEFDIVQSMYDFDSKPYKKVNDSVVSDTDLMFRAGRYDRFLLSVPDISSITSLDIYARAVGSNSSWNLNSMAVQLVGEDKGRTINEYDEYVLNGNIMDIATSSDSLPEKLDCVENADVHKEIMFNVEMSGLITDDDDMNPYSISRLPQSENDSLNVFVFMKDENGDLSKVTMDSTIYYRVAGGTSMEVPQRLRYAKVMQNNVTKQIYYYKGLGAAKLDMLSSIYLKSGEADNPVMVDYAIIQRVRSGVIIDTYKVDFNVDVRYSSKEDIYSSDKSSGESQVVTLQLGSQTSTGVLTPEKYDLAVALQYKTTSDPIGNVYESPYVYLSDSEIYRIKAGQTVDFTFNEKYVKEITGIRVAAVGGLMANVTGGTIAEYTLTGGTEETETTRTLNKWSSIDNNLVIQNRAMPMSVTSTKTGSSDTIIPVEFVFDTATADLLDNPGHTGPIYMKVDYKNYTNEDKEYVITDINDALVYEKNAEGLMATGTFAEGGSAKVRFLLKDVKTIENVTLRPYDSDDANVATWGLKKMALTYGEEITGLKSMSQAVNRLLTETEFKKINTKNILITAKAQSSEDDTIVAETNSAGEPASIGIANDGYISLTIGVSGSTAGWKYRVVREADGADVSNADEYFKKQDDFKATFEPPANRTSAPVTYRIEIISNDSEDCMATVKVVSAVASPVSIKAKATVTPKLIYEREGAIKYNENNVSYSEESLSGEQAALTVASGDVIDFEVEIENSSKGWSYQAQKLVNGSVSSDVTGNFAKKDEKTGTFTVPNDSETKYGFSSYTYKITIISDSDASVKAEFVLSVINASIEISAIVQSVNDRQLAVSAYSNDAEASSIGISGGDSLKFNIQMDASGLGWKYDVTREVNGADVEKCNNCFAKKSETEATFTPPGSYTQGEVTYRVEIISNEDENVKLVIKVVVLIEEPLKLQVVLKAGIYAFKGVAPAEEELNLAAGEKINLQVATSNPQEGGWSYAVTEIIGDAEKDVSDKFLTDGYSCTFTIPKNAASGTIYKIRLYVKDDYSHAVVFNVKVR